MNENLAIKKYLSAYAETIIHSLNDFPGIYDNVLTVPAYEEAPETITRLLRSLYEKSTLIILVVNAQEGAPESARSLNNRLIHAIKEGARELWTAQNDTGITLQETLHGTVLLIDKNTKGCCLPKKTGVGLARKIAADCALQLIATGNVRTNWIHCTDADAILHNNYFASSRDITGYSAAIYPYVHNINIQDPSHKKALLLYEISLRHYVIGLKHAQSNVAYHTIGSTIAMDAEAYARVRGFPIKESGEDFYLLNKLSKVGKIRRVNTLPIVLDGRFSNRVPFGTGKSVEKISALENLEKDFLFYHPIIFEHLKTWIDFIKYIETQPDIERIKKAFSTLTQHKMLSVALEKTGAFFAVATALDCSKKPSVRQQHLDIWFDSFRTLKFIHHLRETAYPSIPLKELIKQPLYQPYNLSSTISLEQMAEHFKDIECHVMIGHS